MDKINKSEQINELITSLVSIQSKLPTMNKGEEGYGYKYASLSATIEDTRKILAEVGLAVIQLTTNISDKPAVVTTLAHTSGQFISSTAASPLVEMKGCNEAQRQGAVYSYLRRYGLQAILNLGAEDNDASSEGFKKASAPKKEFKKNTSFKKPVAKKEVTSTPPSSTMPPLSDTFKPETEEEEIF